MNVSYASKRMIFLLKFIQTFVFVMISITRPWSLVLTFLKSTKKYQIFAVNEGNERISKTSNNSKTLNNKCAKLQVDTLQILSRKKFLNVVYFLGGIWR